MITHEWLGKYAIVKPDISGRYIFTCFHPTLELAKKETERLVRKENSSFLVIQCIGIAELIQQPITWNEIKENNNGKKKTK
jgi:hypothetical protein